MAATIMLAGQSHALSCLRPDAVRVYEQARDSEDLYVMVKGRLSSDGPVNMPVPDATGMYPEQATAETTMEISGELLTAAGFVTAVDREITVSVSCISAWCGTPDMSNEIIAALQIEGSALMLNIGPCGGLTAPVDQNAAARVVACHANGDCQQDG